MNQSRRCASSPWVLLVAVAPGLLTAAELEPSSTAEATVVTVEMTDGSTQTGPLESIDRESIRLSGEQGNRTFSVTSVRTVTRVGIVPPATPDVEVIGTDGCRLSGTDVVWEGEMLSINRPEGASRLPIARVRTIVFRRPAEQSRVDGEPEWINQLPESPDSDIVALVKGDEIQFVECAITGISADKVTVIMDGETIPVKRDRVVGLHWLREPAEATGVAVRVAGGQCSVHDVGWTSDALVLDDMRFPAAAIECIDYASARTVRLAVLESERVNVEPFFGGLGEIEGMADYFRPRAVGGERHDLVMHPRTVAVWRVPEGSRCFSGSLSPWSDAGVGGSVVSFFVDDREMRRIPVDRDAGEGGRIAIEAIPLENARRLSIVVDYGSAGPVGGAVLFHDPVFTR